MIPRLAVAALSLLAASCGGDDGGATACATGASLEIVAPADGASLTMADDADPAAGGLQIELVVHACGIFSTGSQIEVWETAALMTRYAVLDVASDDDLARATVTLVPGDLTFEARTVDATTTSPPISVQVNTD